MYSFFSFHLDISQLIFLNKKFHLKMRLQSNSVIKNSGTVILFVMLNYFGPI